MLRKVSTFESSLSNKINRTFAYWTTKVTLIAMFIKNKIKAALAAFDKQVEANTEADRPGAEIDDIIVDTWPCDFGKLQDNIEATLGKFAPVVNYVKGKWPSYEASKATSQHAYQSDYIGIRLETDQSRSYGNGEVERITVTANPTALDTNYSLVGTGHLLDTKVAQIVIDIAEACDKIRS